MIVLDEAIWRVVWNDGSKVVIKAACDRSIGDGLGEVHIAQRVVHASKSGFAIGGGVGLTEVPFADAGGRVTVLLEQFSNREPIRRDERFVPRSEHIALESCAPRVTTREKRISSGGAHRRRGMRILEPHALTSETVEVGGGDLRVLVVASKVAVTQIIGENEDDIGLLHGV